MVGWTNISEGLTHYLTCLLSHGVFPQHSSQSKPNGMKAQLEQSRKCSGAILVSSDFCLLERMGSLYQRIGEGARGRLSATISLSLKNTEI